MNDIKKPELNSKSKNHNSDGHLKSSPNVLPLTKNHKNYDDVPVGLKWVIPIHECLESPEVKQRSKQLEVEAKLKVEKEVKGHEREKRRISIRCSVIPFSVRKWKEAVRRKRGALLPVGLTSRRRDQRIYTN